VLACRRARAGAAECTIRPGSEDETAVVNTDIDDINIMQGDSNLITQADPFDLLGRAVTFSQSGNGYSISPSAFDTNLGTKVDLTRPPAVNPKVAVGQGAVLVTMRTFRRQSVQLPFLRTSFSTVYISSNGFLSFRPAGIATRTLMIRRELRRVAGQLPDGNPENRAYWHDLDASAAYVTAATEYSFAGCGPDSSTGTSSLTSLTIRLSITASTGSRPLSSAMEESCSLRSADRTTHGTALVGYLQA
jgi:hypothetical protein